MAVQIHKNDGENVECIVWNFKKPISVASVSVRPCEGGVACIHVSFGEGGVA